MQLIKILRQKTKLTTDIGNVYFKSPNNPLFFFLPILSAGVALTYFTIKVSFYWTLFTYGFMFGIGVGIAYATPMGCAMKVIDCLTTIVMIYMDILQI